MASWLDRILDGLDGLGRRAARGLSLDAGIESGPHVERPEPIETPGLASRLGGAQARDGAECPSCGSTLEPRGDGDPAPAFACPRGCGALVSGPSVAQMEAEIEFGVQLAATLDGGAESGRDKLAYRRCPAGDGWMQRVNYMRVSGIMVDYCLRHGLWLDAGELGAIVRFLESGGAERSAAFDRDNRNYVRKLRTSVPEQDDGGWTRWID